ADWRAGGSRSCLRSGRRSLGWDSDQTGGDLPQSGGGRFVVGRLVGFLGLAVGEVSAADTFHIGGAGQVDGGIGPSFGTLHERSNHEDDGSHLAGRVFGAEGGV